MKYLNLQQPYETGSSPGYTVKILEHFGLRISLHCGKKKSLRIPKSFYLCGLYLSVLTIFKIKSKALKHIFKYVSVCVHMYIYVYGIYMCVYICIQICAAIYGHKYVSIYTYICVYIYLHICVCIHTCVCICTYMCVYLI